MKNEKFYVYCKGILGVRTNIIDFKWVYGSIAPCVSQEEYENCAVKFEIYIKPEKKLQGRCNDARFQSYSWDKEKHTISCRRTILGNIRIGYDISLSDDKVVAEIGRNYYKIIRKRVMNLHSIYYLLSDLANLILLKKGYLTLYASGVHFAPQNKGIVCFAPPNTGKTLTATNLCSQKGYSLIGEDILITKDKRVYSCPWTSSYRKKRALFDSAGSIGRVSRLKTGSFCEACDLTDIVVLASGKEQVACKKDELLQHVCILNGYLFNYFSSPIIKILEYFDDSYINDWNQFAQEKIRKLVDSCGYYTVYSEEPVNYSTLIHGSTGGCA